MEEKEAKIRSLRGKYKDVLSPTIGLSDLFAEARKGTSYKTHRLLLELTAQLYNRMIELKLDYPKLAKLTDISESKLSTIFSCGHDVTIRDLIAVADALGYDLCVSLIDRMEEDDEDVYGSEKSKNKVKEVAVISPDFKERLSRLRKSCESFLGCQMNCHETWVMLGEVKGGEVFEIVDYYEAPCGNKIPVVDWEGWKCPVCRALLWTGRKEKVDDVNCYSEEIVPRCPRCGSPMEELPNGEYCPNCGWIDVDV